MKASKELDFIYDPYLVLYLPLHKLDGDSFMSGDPYGEVFTASGATWGMQGRVFSPASYLKSSTANWRGTDSAGTILAWVYTVTESDECIFSSCDEAGGTYYFNFGISNIGAGQNYISIDQRNNDTRDLIYGSTDIPSLGEWVFAALVSNDIAWTIYLNCIPETLTVSSGANNGDWLAETTTRDNVLIGARQRNAFSLYWTGMIGEVYVFNRDLTPIEMQNIYLKTKWRYQ